ncbi:MAG: RNA-directed DNA polymerase [Lachnospiraceae bacterium]|nr:RNA-directed DNA polymerase [Lachnospiraceae bacterium]
MKSYNHLYEEYISDENFPLAVRNATLHKSGNKRKYRKAKYLREHQDELKPELMDYAANFYNDEHFPQTIYDGVRRKQRTIIVPTMREQVIHHMVINVLKPIFMRSMYECSYGSIPGRGATRGIYKLHGAKARGKKRSKRRKCTRGGKEDIESFIKWHPKDCKYCMKLDIHKYFESIPHEILKDKFRKLIHDERFLNILLTIVDANGQDRGIPIGFYTSQWFANFYLTEFDHYVKEVLGAKAYYRYMDDMVFFDSNKRRLRRMLYEINTFLRDRLGLELNPKWQIFLFHYIKNDGTEVGRFLDFMGFRFYRNRTTLRRTLMLRATRKARKLAKKKRKTIHDCRQMLSYKGWISATDTYGMYKKWIKPFVSFRYLRKYESAYSKRKSEVKQNVVQERKWQSGQTGCAGHGIQQDLRLCS